jgi:hypothetical protein
VVPTFRLGKRTGDDANAFVADLSGRVENRVEISSDGLSLYVEAVEQAFGGNVDFGQIVKSYEAEEIGPGRYSPPRVSTVERTTVVGDPQHVSTSYVERLNLLNRMRCRKADAARGLVLEEAGELGGRLAASLRHLQLRQAPSEPERCNPRDGGWSDG